MMFAGKKLQNLSAIRRTMIKSAILKYFVKFKPTNDREPRGIRRYADIFDVP